MSSVSGKPNAAAAASAAAALYSATGTGIPAPNQADSKDSKLFHQSTSKNKNPSAPNIIHQKIIEILETKKNQLLGKKNGTKSTSTSSNKFFRMFFV